MTAMDCGEVIKVLAGERGEDLDEVSSRAFETHLAACNGCREALALAEHELEPLLARLAEPDVSDAAWARVTAAVTAEAAIKPAIPFPARKAEQRSVPLMLASAAAVLLALGFGFFVPLEPIFGPRNAPATSTMLEQPAPVPSGELPPEPGGRVVKLTPGPRFDAQDITIDGLVCILVREKK